MNATDAHPDLLDIVPWSSYWQTLPNLFPTKHTAAWFLKTRKSALIEQGILVETVKGYLVRKAKLDSALVELLQGASK